MSRLDHQIRIVGGVGDIGEEQWALLADTSKQDQNYNPFVSFAFLSALEDSGCVGADAGWLPQFVQLEAKTGQFLGATPCYLKSHSQGEYVFDWNWADAFYRAGGSYYPKLQVSIPFTPATGPRLLLKPDSDQSSGHTALGNGLMALCGRIQASSVHVTFASKFESKALIDIGFLHRTDQQFHFKNENYSDFEDFLAGLSSRKRKTIKRERRIAVEDEIAIEWLRGSEITEAVWDSFYSFYVDTGSRKWGSPYLNRTFFSLIGERMADDILLVMARRNGRYVAGAINFIGGDTLYGRNWGCIEHHPLLHFEVCYYQAIEFAIQNNLRIVEAGAQGEHKLSRGYQPVTTHSAHYIAHPGLREAIAEYLVHERNEVARIGDILTQHTPFRKDL